MNVKEKLEKVFSKAIRYVDVAIYRTEEKYIPIGMEVAKTIVTEATNKNNSLID